MTSENNQGKPIDYPTLVDDIRHELGKVYHLNMNPAMVLDTIDILIHEHTGLACMADTTETCHPRNKGLQINRPPQEKDLWRVVYVIDVDATDANAAAKEAHETMIDPDSMAPVLHVIGSVGVQLTIDLSKDRKRR